MPAAPRRAHFSSATSSGRKDPSSSAPLVACGRHRLDPSKAGVGVCRFLPFFFCLTRTIREDKGRDARRRCSCPMTQRVPSETKEILDSRRFTRLVRLSTGDLSSETDGNINHVPLRHSKALLNVKCFLYESKENKAAGACDCFAYRTS